MLVPVLALALAAVAPPAVKAGECVVVAPLNGGEVMAGGDECTRRTLPASTVKVPHALVALQTKVVDGKTVIKWDGKKRDYEVWNRDQTLESAIRMSLRRGESAEQTAAPTRTHGLIELWSQGKAAFGVYAPNENPGPRGQRGQPPPPAVYTRAGGEKLAMNPLYDYVFLNLEGRYDADAVKAMADGLRSPNAVSRKALIVRIPPIDVDGAAAAKARVKEALDNGADGVTIPHVTSVEEAKLAISFFQDAKANVWSPSNPGGRTIAMLMLEDPAAVAQAKEVADLKGYSILACGIGSLTQALGGDRAGAEAGTQKVLAEAKRAKLADMLTANPQDVAQRVKEGFLALLMQGPTADEAITIGRQTAGR